MHTRTVPRPPNNVAIRQVNTFEFLVSWYPSNEKIVDYRVFLNNEDINSGGRQTLANSYTITDYRQDSLKVQVRTTANPLWSDVATANLTDLLRKTDDMVEYKIVKINQ